MDYTIDQIVYEVGIHFSTGKASVTEQKILCVGEKALFVCGTDCVWGGKNESTLYLTFKDSFAPVKVLSSNTETVWTDDKDKADSYAKQMNDIINLRVQISKTA